MNTIAFPMMPRPRNPTSIAMAPRPPRNDQTSTLHVTSSHRAIVRVEALKVAAREKEKNNASKRRTRDACGDWIQMGVIMDGGAMGKGTMMGGALTTGEHWEGWRPTKVGDER
ncbi:hypothetical protein GUJ93_ZPchr0609g26850 [Zizania palustris]|uniref:Uncharacterized protein n=1 Tax=Zizania palustris TaxID=103762 RepID=A0A8J5QW96_ZIZPA|nr:hypothetical protein GUJ93_ZPchr0609g26850 [Zizania palustris]